MSHVEKTTGLEGWISFPVTSWDLGREINTVLKDAGSRELLRMTKDKNGKVVYFGFKEVDDAILHAKSLPENYVPNLGDDSKASVPISVITVLEEAGLIVMSQEGDYRFLSNTKGFSDITLKTFEKAHSGRIMAQMYYKQRFPLLFPD